MMAHVADYLSSISFYWPIVSAQDYGQAAPLHELDASFNNTVKHIQSATIIGKEIARNSLRMAEVLVGGSAAPDYEETLRETGALLVEDLTEFQAALEKLGSSRGRGEDR